jgi:hypothetical protein
VFRGVFFCLLLASAASGESLDDAVHALARKVVSQFESNPTPHVTLRNISSLDNTVAGRARTLLERALHSASTRSGPDVEITLTVSQNIGGYLLIAEYERNGDRIQEMEPWQPDEPAPHAMRSSINARLLWEQDSPMLDLAVLGDRMFILEPAALVIYMRGAAGWERPDSHALDNAPVERDPRGRLQVSGDSFVASLPGVTCHAAWNPAFEAQCAAPSAPFPVANEQARFSAGRNTLELEGWPSAFSFAAVDQHGRPLYLAAEADDRAHIYNSDRKPRGEIDSWGDDFVAVANGCASGEILATAPGDRASSDSLTAFDPSGAQPVAVSEPVDLPGPVLALWPADNGALAIVRNLVSGQYAAYSVGIDCSH